jgi:hypothetical protein
MEKLSVNPILLSIVFKSLYDLLSVSLAQKANGALKAR